MQIHMVEFLVGRRNGKVQYQKEQQHCVVEHGSGNSINEIVAFIMTFILYPQNKMYCGQIDSSAKSHIPIPILHPKKNGQFEIIHTRDQHNHSSNLSNGLITVPKIGKPFLHSTEKGQIEIIHRRSKAFEMERFDSKK
jgi:hypothetical protein